MKYSLLGPTGMRVSKVCLGTATFGVAPSVQDADAVVAVRRASSSSELSRERTDRASLDAFFAQHTMRARSGRVRARVLVARRSSSRARERVGVSRDARVLRVPHEDSDES